MSKEIYLYSEDKKYKCAVELADTCDKFGCPDHSMIILTEERPDDTYVIAQAKDGILETEKDKQIADLQSQLAEKDKELKQVKLDLGMFKSVNEFINSYGIEKAREVLLQTKKTKNQDKISFALEQLEKVKELCKTKFEWWENSEWEGNIYDKSDVSNAYFDIEANIDQQIALLKGKVEDE